MSLLVMIDAGDVSESFKNLCRECDLECNAKGPVYITHNILPPSRFDLIPLTKLHLHFRKVGGENGFWRFPHPLTVGGDC